MRKSLSEMTLEELWALFPIILTPHQLVWRQWYQDEETQLQIALEKFKPVRICHIGSTSIPNIWAKSIYWWKFDMELN